MNAGPSADKSRSRLTLAIPNRNGSRFIGSTLESLCSASNRPFLNWWLQDCCSDDDSTAIAETFRSPGDTIRTTRDTGQANGINRAFGEMGGDIVGYINSDDCLAEGAVDAVLSTFLADDNVDIVVGEVDWIDQDGNIIGHHKGQIASLEDVLDIHNVWWGKKQWVQPEVFFRRKLYEQVGGFDESYSLAFDFDFWVRVLRLRPKVVSIPKTLVRFRRHDQQRSNDFERANDEIRRSVSIQLEDPTCPISHSFRRKLQSRMSYERYHSKSPLSPVANLSFAAALLKCPEWLLLPEIRSRLSDSVKRQLKITSRNTQ
jgi:glycosyltransferase involved in cell wall biosynthesis